MLGLSQIWDEIRQADLRTGDNRQNLLLESIAGKNRASIASSILQNPDVLQSVYEDSSTKSAGSAMEENQKYLDSISGHLAKLQNAWQELWANAANRDVINMFIDLGTTILNLINDVGGLQSAFTLLWGGAIVKGLATADSWLVKFVRGLDAAKASSQGLGNTLSNIFTNLTGSTGDTTKETRWKGLAQIQKDREQQAQQQPTTIADTANDIALTTSKETKAKAARQAAQANLEEATSEEILQAANSGNAQAEAEETSAKAQGIATSQQAIQSNLQEAETAKLAADALREKAEADATQEVYFAHGMPDKFSKRQQKEIAKLTQASIDYDTILPKMQKASGKGTMDWTMAYVDGIEDIGEEAMKTGEQIAQMGNIAGNAATAFGAIGITLAGLATNPMTWLIAVPAILTTITGLYSAWQQKQQALIDQAHEATNTWNENQTSIENYSKRYQELNAQLESPNLSEEERIDITKQIYDLQKEITKEYGNAAKGIDLVNGKLDEQLAKLKNINITNARDNLRDNRDAYNKARANMEEINGYSVNIGSNNNVVSQIQELIDKKGLDLKISDIDYGGVAGETGGLTGKALTFKGTAIEADEQLKALSEELNNLKDSMGEDWDTSGLGSFLATLDSSIQKNQETLTKFKDDYMSYLEQSIYADSDPEGKDALFGYMEAMENYNQALSLGDTSQIDEAAQKFQEATEAKEEFLKNSKIDYSPLFEDLDKQLNKTAEEAYNVKKKFDDPNTKNIVESILGSPKENKKSAEDIPDSLREAAENILDEQRKAYDWGMKPLGVNPLQGLYSQSQFGNIDMNNRPEIKWNEEYRKRFAEALKSWNYAPEDGIVDTVYGASSNFNGLEIAFTPILATEDGKLKDFMSYDAVHEYIQGLVDKATDKDGHIDAQLVLDLDAGKVKDKDIIPKQIIGAIDGIGKYSAATVGKMMHFSGTKGSIYLGMEQLSQAAEKAGVDVNKVMEILRNTGNVDALAGVFDDFKYDLADIEGQLSDLPNASDDILKLADAFGITADSSQESINAVAELLGSLGYIATNSMDEAGESFDKFTQKASGWIEETSNLSSTLSKGQGFLTFTKTQDEQGHDIASEVKTIADAYKDLEGYNYATLFEETAGGIMVNAEALRALQSQEESMRHAEFYEKRQELMEKFTASSGAAAEAYRAQIEELDMLWSAYSGATSALSKYQNGHGAADYSTNYKLFRDQIFKEGDAYLESGEIGEEGFRRVAQLFSYKDLALASVDEVVEAYQKGADTMQRFFTEDPTEGANLWIDEIMSWPEEYAEISTNAAGETVMTMTDKNLDAVAEHYGVSKDLILSLMNELNATGSRVHFFTDGQMQQLDAVTEKAEAARQRLLEIRDQGTDPALANSDILNFDIANMSADELKAKIEEIQSLQADPDIDTETASLLNDFLQAAIDRLDLLNGKHVEPDIQMDTDGLNHAEEVTASLNDRLDQIGRYRKMGYEFSISGDKEVQEVAEEIASWPEEMQMAYGFEPTEDPKEILSQIEKDFSDGVKLKVKPEVDKKAKEQAAADSQPQPKPQQGSNVTDTHTTENITKNETIATADTDQASQHLIFLDGLIQDIDGRTFTVTGDANTDNAEEKLSSAGEKTDSLDGRKATVTVGGNTAPFNKSANEVKKTAGEIGKQKPKTEFKGDASGAVSAAHRVKNAIDDVPKKKDSKLSVTASGIDTVRNFLHNVYNKLTNKSVKIETKQVTTKETIYKTSSGGHQVKVDGTAHVQGTVMSGGKAYATGGDWGLPKAEKGALINELGSEILVRDGQWQVINNGDPTFVDLKPGDIIFNHKQAKELLKNGRVTGSHGKLVGGAFARGTVDEDEDMNEEDLDELTGNAFALGTTEWDGRLSGESHAVGGTIRRASTRSRSGSSSSNKSNKSSGKSSDKSSGHSGKSSGSNSNKSNKSSSNTKAKNFLETLDSIEVQINRIDALFQRLDTNIGKTFASFSSRTTDATTEITKLGEEIKRIDASFASTDVKKNYLYKAGKAAKEAGLKKGDEGYTAGAVGASGTALSNNWIKWIRNSVDTGKYMTIDDVKDEGLWKKVQAYQTWYEKYLKLQQKRQDYVNKMSQLTIQQLQLIQTEWEAVLNNLNAYITENQSRVDLQTEQGYDASVRYYNNQISYNETRIKDLKEEAEDLQTKLNEAVSAGYITKYSEEWYKWQTQIKNTQNEVINTTKEIARLNNEIRQLKWDRFDRAQDKLSDLAEEMEFLNGLIYENDKFTEEGNITKRGRAAMGLIAMQYDEYVKQAKRYQKEVNALNKELANDPYNNKLIEQRNTWLKAQQDAIENARQQKEAMADLIEDGIKKQIDYMDELIDKYEDALDAEKAQNKYAEEMAEKQKKVNSIQKQLRALEGDDSEEGQTKRQKLRDDLKEAQKDLKDAQEDQRLSDISDALSEMQEKYEDVLNARLDNIDKLFAESITTVNQNGASIVSEIKAIGKSVDYNFSELLNGIVTDKSVRNKASDTSSKALVSGTNDTTGKLTNTSAAAVKDRGTGWKKSGNDWYYADEYGNAKTGWVKDKNKWYYLDDNGKMTKGWQNINNKWYYMDENGAMKTGWQKSNNKWYYLDKKTGAMTTGWQKDQDKWYYMDQTGKMTTGWQQINKKWYYMNGSGQMQKGWKKSNNKWYYLKDDGSMATGWQKVSNKWYYMDNSGAMTTGWQKVNNKWYYMNGSGQMLTGVQKIGKGRYCLGEDGALRIGKFVFHGVEYTTDSSGDITTKKRVGLYDSIKAKGKYAKGTAKVKQTDLYQVDEEGKEVFINKQGKIYTRLEKGSTVLPHDAAVNLLKGMTNPTEFIANHMDMRPNKNITTTNNTSGNVTNYITFNMDGVTNYQEFMREAQRDPNFTKYIQEISIGKLNGNNSLKGNSIRFR